MCLRFVVLLRLLVARFDVWLCGRTLFFDACVWLCVFLCVIVCVFVLCGCCWFMCVLCLCVLLCVFVGVIVCTCFVSCVCLRLFARIDVVYVFVVFV